MKLTPGVNFINILRTRFSYQSAIFCQNLTKEKLLLHEKRARKMLMKLTTDRNMVKVEKRTFIRFELVD